MAWVRGGTGTGTGGGTDGHGLKLMMMAAAAAAAVRGDGRPGRGGWAASFDKVSK